MIVTVTFEDADEALYERVCSVLRAADLPAHCALLQTEEQAKDLPVIEYLRRNPAAFGELMRREERRDPGWMARMMRRLDLTKGWQGGV